MFSRFTLFILLFTIGIVCNLQSYEWVQTNGPKNSSDAFVSTNTLVRIANGTIIAGSEYEGVFKTTNYGNSWSKVFNLDYNAWKVGYSGKSYIFVTTDLDGIYRSTDQGSSFSKVFDSQNQFVFDVSFDPDNLVYACLEQDGLYKANSNGQNWNLFWSTDIIPICMQINDNYDVFVGSGTDGIYRSTDGGASFENVGFSGQWIWDVIVDGSNVYACTEGSGLNLSTNNGNTWDNIGFPGSSVSEFLLTPDGIMLAVVDFTEIYIKLPGNPSWEYYSHSLSPNGINDLDIDDKGYVYAACFGDGVFKSAKSMFPAVLGNIGNLAQTYCAGQVVNVNYTATGGFDYDNTFTVEISDASGSFGNPTVIGTLDAQETGTIECVIPFDLPAGSNYKLRIKSSNPVLTGPATANTFSITELNTNLSQPADNAVDVDLKPTFTWVLSNCAASYHFQISTDETFNNVIIDEYDIVGNSFTPPNNLTQKTEYFWRIGLITNLGDEKFTNPFSFTTLENSEVTQNIQLKSGWNQISTYIIAPDMNVSTIFAAIVNNLLIAKDNIGRVYIPSFGINQINDIISSQGYKVYMQSANTLEITGEQIDPLNHSISVNFGWNLIAYLRDTQMDAVNAFVGLTSKNILLIAKNLEGAVYIPSFGINSLGNLQPGQAYQIYVTQNDSFKYPGN